MPHWPARLLWSACLAAVAVLATVAGTAMTEIPAPAGAITPAPTSRAVPACSVGNLRLVPGAIRGAARGALSVGVTVRNVSPRSCRLARLPQTTSIVEGAGGRVFATAMTGRLYAANPTAGGSSAGRSELQRSTVVLGPRGSARAHVVWADWCGGGVRQWGIRLHFSGQRRALYTLVIGDVAPGSMGSVVPPVPSCHHGIRSSVTITPLARLRTV